MLVSEDCVTQHAAEIVDRLLRACGGPNSILNHRVEDFLTSLNMILIPFFRPGYPTFQRDEVWLWSFVSKKIKKGGREFECQSQHISVSVR